MKYPRWEYNKKDEPTISKPGGYKIMEKIEIDIYYYIDDKGNKVYDIEAMSNEFENKLSELTNCVVMCSVEEE